MSALSRSDPTPPAIRPQQRPRLRRRWWPRALAGTCFVALCAGWMTMPASGSAAGPPSCGSVSTPAVFPTGQPPLSPAAPLGLTAAAGDSQVTLSWSPPSGGVQPGNGYYIYEGTSPGGESSSPVSAFPVHGTSDTVTGLCDGTTYYFVVTAVDKFQGPRSNEASATPVPATRLGAPTGLTAKAADSQVTLSWSPPASGGGQPLIGYEVYMGTSSGNESPEPVNGTTPVPGTSYTVTGLANGTLYYFKVAAIDQTHVTGTPSAEVSATPGAVTQLGAPTGLTATAGDSRVTLSWSPPAPNGASVDGYDIYRGTSRGGESGSPVNTSLVQGTSYTVTGLANGTTYYFTVAAVNQAGQRGPSSGQASATPHRPPPPPPPPSGRLIGHALPPPSWSVFTLPKVLESLALAAFLVVLVGFPAELFNQTYEENEARIRRALSRVIPWKARETGSAIQPGAAFIFFAVAAALTTLVEPTFDFGWTGATVFAGFLVAIPLTMTAYSYPAEWYQRRASKITGRFRVIALALVVAAALAVMSRLVHFVPGYVYGLIAGFAAARTLSKSQEAKSVLAGAACVFGLSVVAWILWGKYDAVAEGSHASHAEVIIGAILAQLAILGITSVVFGLMPFKFMDGYRLRTWNLAGWIGAYAVAAFWFALVLIRNNRDVLQQHNLPVAFAEPFILFAVFGVLSVLFWLYFRFRPSPQNAAEDGPTAQAAPPARQAVTSPDLTGTVGDVAEADTATGRGQ